jgi:hypothetical protein
VTEFRRQAQHENLVDVFTHMFVILAAEAPAQSYRLSARALS